MDGLKISIEEPTGVKVGYWVADEVTTRERTHQVTISVLGYVDKAAYEAGKQPVTHKVASFDMDHTPEIEAARAQVLAQAAKAETMFKGATVVAADEPTKVE